MLNLWGRESNRASCRTASKTQKGISSERQNTNEERSIVPLYLYGAQKFEKQQLARRHLAQGCAGISWCSDFLSIMAEEESVCTLLCFSLSTSLALALGSYFLAQYSSS
jgi:hypothetical protein